MTLVLSASDKLRRCTADVPAVINPLPAWRIAVDVDPDAPKRYFVKCSRCHWMPEVLPLDEAGARIAAYEHNAAKHPHAMVEEETIGQEWAQQSRWLRRQIKVSFGACLFTVVVATLIVAFLYDQPLVAAFVCTWIIIASFQGMMLGGWQVRLAEHRRRPPGSLVVSPPVEDEEP